MPHPLEVAEAALLSFLLVAAAAEGMGLWAVAVGAGCPSGVAAEVGPWPVVAAEAGPWPVVAAMWLLVLEVAVEAPRQRQRPWVASVAGLLSQAAAAADPAMRLARRQVCRPRKRAGHGADSDCRGQRRRTRGHREGGAGAGAGRVQRLVEKGGRGVQGAHWDERLLIYLVPPGPSRRGRRRRRLQGLGPHLRAPVLLLLLLLLLPGRRRLRRAPAPRRLPPSAAAAFAVLFELPPVYPAARRSSRWAERAAGTELAARGAANGDRAGDGATAVGIEAATGIVAAIVGGVTRAGAGGGGGRWRGAQVAAAREDGRERGWR